MKKSPNDFKNTADVRVALFIENAAYQQDDKDRQKPPAKYFCEFALAVICLLAASGLFLGVQLKEHKNQNYWQRRKQEKTKEQHLIVGLTPK